MQDKFPIPKNYTFVYHVPRDSNTHLFTPPASGGQQGNKTWRRCHHDTTWQTERTGNGCFWVCSIKAQPNIALQTLSKHQDFYGGMSLQRGAPRHTHFKGESPSLFQHIFYLETKTTWQQRDALNHCFLSSSSLIQSCLKCCLLAPNVDPTDHPLLSMGKSPLFKLYPRIKTAIVSENQSSSTGRVPLVCMVLYRGLETGQISTSRNLTVQDLAKGKSKWRDGEAEEKGASGSDGESLSSSFSTQSFDALVRLPSELEMLGTLFETPSSTAKQMMAYKPDTRCSAAYVSRYVNYVTQLDQWTRQKIKQGWKPADHPQIIFFYFKKPCWK